MPNNLGIQIAIAAAQGFKNLECVQCATKVIAALTAAGQKAELIELRTNIPLRNIVLIRDGSIPISENGYHCGVKIEEIVIDNLHPNGIPYTAWVNSFEAFGGLRSPMSKAV